MRRILLTLSPLKPFHPLIACLLLFALTGCFEWDQNQSALDPKGPIARDQYDAFMLTLYITIFLTVTVGGTMLIALIRFRAKPTDDKTDFPKQSHGNPLIEVGLIAASAILLVIIAIPTLRGIHFMAHMPEEYKENAITVNVTGYQWWWEFEYPDLGITTANELVFPKDSAVHLNLRSADVIHSFWLPKLAGKTDLIPGRENTMWIKADEEGQYWGQCAEFCGESHAYMLFRAMATSQEEFDAWVETQKSGPAVTETTDILEPGVDKSFVLEGKQHFDNNCLSCHKVGDAGGIVAPNLTHFGSRKTIAAGWLENNESNLKHWITDPEAVKPGNFMWHGIPLPGGAGVMEGLKDKNLTEEQIDAIVAYLTALK